MIFLNVFLRVFSNFLCKFMPVEQPLQGFDAVYLLGNHEQTLLDFLQVWLDQAA